MLLLCGFQRRRCISSASDTMSFERWAMLLNLNLLTALRIHAGDPHLTAIPGRNLVVPGITFPIFREKIEDTKFI